MTVTLVGDSGISVPVSARLGNRPARQALGRVGGSLSLVVPGAGSGWWTLTADLDPDEFRLDDRRVAAVRIAPLVVEETEAEDYEGPLPAYEFEPDAEDLLKAMLPKYINTRIYTALLDAAAAESASRRRLIPT